MQTELDGSPLEIQISKQLDIAHELALSGADSVARSIGAAIFLRHGFLLASNLVLQRKLVRCLLLLEMTCLLARLLHAFHGAEVTFSVLAEPGPRRLVVAFGNRPALLMHSLGAEVDGGERIAAADRWSAVIINAAGCVADPPGHAWSSDPVLPQREDTLA